MKATDEFYKTQAWISLCKSEKKRRGGLCERCLAKGLIAPGEILHHKIRLKPGNMYDPDIALNPDNLELLCRKCHGMEHSGRRFTVDACGRVIF